ncbi:hypothetical protein SERLA73DRAFT_173907 [Serpula lacrymans var. lacrymans S7.3]|uniref:Mid2 domain-containing protein n=1 Tax=Serpula lacrymans var. lacrymans (strain S7.3) TaxID=936435 RepID=F8PF15_SERL3|nr:hypothetical protein SERLA73DRAFT_173907 [Serpula lacrymans var. lacrymans S7.3]
MIVAKHRLTFFFSFALFLAFTVVADAKTLDQSAPLRRDHTRINRIVKKRSPVPQGLGGLFGGDGSGVVNAGANPPTVTPTSSTATTSSTIAPSTDKSTDTASSATPSSPSASTTASISLSSSASATSNNPLGGFVSSLFSPASSTASASTNSPSSASSSPTTASESETSTTPTPTPTTPPAVSQSVSRDGSSGVTVVVTGSPTSSTASSTSTSTSSGTIAHTTEVALIIIGACIVGAGIIWTIIRKWKFRPSANFEDRMQPIDWQPTTDSGLPAHRRNSNASSFHSGHSETNYAGRGGGGSYGSDHGHGVAPLNPIPDHDFTAGTGGLASAGGYADLVRGPSPQPQMQEALSHGPSMARPEYDQYGVPLHHAGYSSQDPYARY